MNRRHFLFSAFIVSYVNTRQEAKQKVEFTSPTECKGNHGVYRWDAKTEQELSTRQDTITKVTVADMAGWPVPKGEINKNTKRLPGREQEWFELTATVVLVKCEDDGDLHVQLQDQGKDSPQVVVEVPLGETWDSIREEIFSWSRTKFPCEPHQLKLRKKPTIKITGKAFFDAEHDSKEKPGWRSYDKNVLVWELHPVMKIVILEHEVKP